MTMKKLLFAVFSVFISSAALADAMDYGLIAGFRSQSGDIDTSGQSVKSAVGYQLGAIGNLKLHDSILLRSGLMYVERPTKLSVDGTNAEADAKLTYFDVPVNLAFKFEDYASIYFGVNLSLNLSSSLSASGGYPASKLNDVKSMVVPITLGADFRFAPQMGANLFFETLSGEVAQGLKNYRAVGANFIYYFD